MNKFHFSRRNRHRITIVLLPILFFILSLVIIISSSRGQKTNYRSSQLDKIITRTDNTERIDYKDKNHMNAIAVDLGYATSIATTNSNTSLVEYYDEHGIPICRNLGYYSLLKEYDENKNIICIAYLDEDKNPTITKDGYAIEKRKYNENKKVVAIRYYDREGYPVYTPAYGYGMNNEYDDNGMNTKTFYVDSSGQPIVTEKGYAYVVRDHYLVAGPKYGQIKNEFYYDEHEIPVSLQLGQYGVYYEYNEEGQNILVTYLDEKGDPIITNKGYTTIRRTFSSVDSAITEQYFDIEGNPFCLSEGQYGIRRENGQTVFLNERGTELFNIRNILYHSYWLAIPLTFVIILVASICSKRINAVLIISYVLIIIYFTLLFRENIGDKGIDLFRSYRSVFTDGEARIDIIMNIWLFIPLGAVLYQIYPKKIILLFPVMLSILIECIQLFTHTGFCQLDDVINNGLGGYIGFYTAEMTIHLFQRIKSWGINYSVKRR